MPVMDGLISSDRFHISKPLNLSTSEQLLGHKKLKVVQFHNFKPDDQTLNILNNLFKQRKELTLRIYGYSAFWADISFISQLPELERFNWNTDDFGSVKPLYRLKKLKHIELGFSQPKPKISLKFLADFKETLESVSLLGDYKDLTTAIPTLKNLKTIGFSSTKLDGFDFLENLSVEEIGVYGSRVDSFEFIENLKSLKGLWIKTNTKLNNIDFIESLSLLERIELFYVSKITKFPKCNHLKNLKKIFLFECNRLENIEEVKKLKHCSICITGKKLDGRIYKQDIQ